MITEKPGSLLPAKITRQPPVTIDALLTKAEFLSLVEHMTNGNPLSHFLTIWRDDDGSARFAKAKPHKRVTNQPGARWISTRTQEMMSLPRIARLERFRYFSSTATVICSCQQAGAVITSLFLLVNLGQSQNGRISLKILANASGQRFRTECVRCFPANARKNSRWAERSVFLVHSIRRPAKSS